MFSEEAKRKVMDAIYAETENAYDNYGEKYNSLHEGYAVLKEEVEEVGENHEIIKTRLDLLWAMIKQNETTDVKSLTEYMKEGAKDIALEACQVAAVCNKILNTLEDEK